MSGVQGMHRGAEARRTARDRIWQSMRILRRFNLADLATTAEAGSANCLKYASGLCACGVLRVVTPRATGKKGGCITFAIALDLGPKAPRLRADGTTYDPNAHRVLDGGLRQSSPGRATA